MESGRGIMKYSMRANSMSVLPTTDNHHQHLDGGVDVGLVDRGAIWYYGNSHFSTFVLVGCGLKHHWITLG